jgi:hypothetical protein
MFKFRDERDRDQALIEVQFNEKDIQSAGRYFDNVINTIQKRDLDNFCFFKDCDYV